MEYSRNSMPATGLTRSRCRNPVADGGSDECEYESHQSLKPVSVKSVSETDTYIVDLGQNIAGWIRMKVKGNRGDR